MDLEKPHDEMPRKEVWYCMREYRVTEKYVSIVQDMHNDSTTGVSDGVTE